MTAVTTVRIVYGSQSGDSMGFARSFYDSMLYLCGPPAMEEGVFEFTLCSIDEIDPESLPKNLAASPIYIFFLSTYTDGGPSTSAEWFYNWLQDLYQDFRVDRNCMAGLPYAVFGLCDSAFPVDQFNLVASNVNTWLSALGATRLVHLGVGDKQTHRQQFLIDWVNQVSQVLKLFASGTPFSSAVLAQFLKTDSSSFSELDVASASSEDDEASSPFVEELVDLEDLNSLTIQEFEELGNTELKDLNEIRMYSIRKKEEHDPTYAKFIRKPKVTNNPMVTPELYSSLTKQGYKIIGSHSGVKLCRWTKSMLRGRGGCYKHTFYGIASHRCMEATPSLACANKCVFCWRHNTNPVGTEWKWKLEPAELIFQGAIDNHRQMIKAMRGLPGADAERIKEAMTVKHCALSLVGEPIMYPYINDLLTLLHRHQISTYMVTNAQFPDRIAQLIPVTQLYVSVDAATKSALKKVDRPLFKDYWERFLASLEALRAKGQRTVYRLTLVAAYNMENLREYAELVKLGMPDFIEVKGVTYCGTSSQTTESVAGTEESSAPPVLTMKNSPFHKDVLEFCEQLSTLLQDSYLLPYEISCEHEHSNCVLISNADKFKSVDPVNGQISWNTWIDYDKFSSLVNSGKPFSSQDYVARTPDWAVYGSKERGFDPEEQRHYRQKTKATRSLLSDTVKDSCCKSESTASTIVDSCTSMNCNSKQSDAALGTLCCTSTVS